MGAGWRGYVHDGRSTTGGTRSAGPSWTYPGPIAKPMTRSCPPPAKSPTRSMSSSSEHKIEDCRRRIQNQTLHHRGHKNDPLYRSRKLLTMSSERLDCGPTGTAGGGAPVVGSARRASPGRPSPSTGGRVPDHGRSATPRDAACLSPRRGPAVLVRRSRCDLAHDLWVRPLTRSGRRWDPGLAAATVRPSRPHRRSATADIARSRTIRYR